MLEIGVNLSGAEYTSGPSGQAYTFPTHDEIDYFAAQGSTIIRIPLSWEGLQPTLGGALDANYLANLQSTVAYANSQGLKVDLDLHNYGYYNGNLIGSPQVPTSAFADVWGKLAGAFSKNSNVLFGLMNEPQVATAGAWLTDVNAAIAAIRGTGATSQEILVSGIAYDNADNWFTSGNASVFGAPGAIVDPAKNYAFEIHEYLDLYSEGQSSDILSTTIGPEKLAPVTAWAKQIGAKLFLGETGVSSGTDQLTALNNLFGYLQQNSSVWQGATYWAAGQNWGDYMYSVEPKLGLVDMLQINVLKAYDGATTTKTLLAGGNTQVNTFAPGRTSASLIDVYNAQNTLVSRSLFNATGALDRTLSIASNGNMTLSIYDTMASPTEIDVFDKAYNLLQKTAVSADGSKRVDFYAVGSSDALTTDLYGVDGSLTSHNVNNADGTHVAWRYTNGVLSVVQVFDANYHVTEQDGYTNGILASADRVQASGGHVIEYFDATGKKVVNVGVYDAAWNQLSYSAYKAPTIAITSQVLASDTGASATDGVTRNGQVTLSGSVASLLTTSVEVFDGTNDLGKATVAANGTWSYQTTLGSGAHLLDAVATDLAGGVGTSASAAKIVVDTQAPMVDIVSETYSAASGKTTVLGTASGATAITVELYANTTDLGAATLDGKGNWAYTGALAPGSYNITAVATDLAGNTASIDPPLDVPENGSLTLGYALAQEHLTYASGQSYLTGPDGIAHDVTGVQRFVFTDGTITENTGAGALVDNLYYDINNLDVWNAHVDPTTHYDTYGWREGRDPNALFSTEGYLAANPDVKAAGINPLTHYDTFGWREGRDPSANFNSSLYLANNPDVKASGMDPLVHYLDYGQKEGLSTSPAIGPAQDFTHGSFDPEYYLLANEDVARAALSSGQNTLQFAYQHYDTSGWREGRNPNALFSTSDYLAANSDVRAAGIDPLTHYDTYGWHEGRNPSASFNTAAYEAANPDVKAAHVDPLTHYLQFGVHEGRAA